MPRLSRSVSHQSQRSQADCLPVVLKMVTAYLGHPLSYQALYTLLDTQWYGTPFRRVERLAQHGLQVTIDHLALPQIAAYLAQDLPVIAGVHTGPLSYWTQAVDHVVCIVGIVADTVYVHDPSRPAGPQAIPRVEFELAQLDFDNLCAVIS